MKKQTTPEDLLQDMEGDSDVDYSNGKKKRKFQCTICKKRYTEKSYLNDHLKTHSDLCPYECDLCPYKGKTKKYLTRHKTMVHTTKTKVQCEVCNKTVASKSLPHHLRTHTGEKPYKCDDCGKAFNSTYSLQTHKYIHTNEKPFQCSFCEYACRDTSTLRKHQDKHMGLEKFYQCTICDRRVKSKVQLKMHIAERHLAVDVRKHECTLCNKKFKEKAVLNAHIQAVHERSKTAKCEICDTVISNKYNMPAHLTTHADYRPFKCDYKDCGKGFKDMQALRRHNILHYPERQTPCKKCGKLFARQTRLNYHMKTVHAKKQKVYCLKCGSCFMSESRLQIHMRRKHVRKKAKYICDMCDFVTYNKPSLVMHIKYGHDKIKKYGCEICKKTYKRETNLMLHIVRRHKPKKKVPVMPKPLIAKVKIKEEPKDDSDEDFVVNDERVLADLVPKIENIEDPNDPEPEVPQKNEDQIAKVQEILSKEEARSIIESHRTCLKDVPEEVFDEFFIKAIFKAPGKDAVSPEEHFKQRKEELAKRPVKRVFKSEHSIFMPNKTIKMQSVKDCLNFKNLIKKRIRIKIKEPKSDSNSLSSLNLKQNTEFAEGLNNELVSHKHLNEENDDLGDSDNFHDDHDTDTDFTYDEGEIVKEEIEFESTTPQIGFDGNTNFTQEKICDESIENMNVSQEQNDTVAHDDRRVSDDSCNDSNFVHGEDEKIEDIHVSGEQNQTGAIDKENINNDVDIANKEKHFVSKEDELVSENITNKNTSPEQNESEANDDEEESDFVDDDKDSDYVYDEEERDSETVLKNSKNKKLQFNTHQCYVCFKLFDTQDILLNHCKEHFDVCNKKTLKKCPKCDYVTYMSITKHMKLVHKMNLKVSYGQVKDKVDNKHGSRYYYAVKDKNIREVEIIPSVKHLNRQAYVKIDKQRRLANDRILAKTKLVRKGKEWVVEKEKIDSSDYIIPKFDDDTLSCEEYLAKIQHLYHEAKKNGSKILFPCNSCEKICRTLSALKLHSRRHDPNAKPFKKKVWKHKSKTVPKKKDDIPNTNLIENRLAKPKPVVNKHKCDKELIDFYENNIKGKDIEFWQFLKIYNKMGRDNITDFSDLKHNFDYGIQAITENVPTDAIVSNDSNVSDSIIINDDMKKNNRRSIKKVKTTFTRVVRLSRKENLKRIAAKKRLREKIANAKLKNNIP